MACLAIDELLDITLIRRTCIEIDVHDSDNIPLRSVVEHCSRIFQILCLQSLFE